MKKVINIIAKALALVAFLVGSYMACLLDSENWMAPFTIMRVSFTYLFLYGYAKGCMY